jgi:putative spermidine/putrescine transport system substrate-binding protein
MLAKNKALQATSALLVIVALGLSACGGAATTAAPAATEAPAVDWSTVSVAETGGGMDALVAAAKAEGQLTVIALPHDWCNYGEVIDSFKAKYGLTVNELNPDAGSGDEVEAIKANKDNKGPQAPDVIDVGFAFGDSSKADGLITPYKVSTWATIPDGAKDAAGYWYGDYYGVLAFQVNADVVKNIPQDWSDLLKPEYKSSVGVSGDPRTSNQAIQTVFASGLANGGSLDDAQAGLDFFAKLNAAGNLVPVIANNALVEKGETPIRITWDYNALAGRDAATAKTEVVVPASGRFAGVYVQAISAYAPHPAAARLWMEYLYSDEGQLLWLKGYCHPIREPDLRSRSVIPADILAKLPDISGAVFPTAKQLADAKALITANWDSVVGADIQAAP